MRRQIISSLTIAALVLAGSACQKQENDNAANGMTSVIFTAKAEGDEDVKATVNEGDVAKFLWETSDAIGLAGTSKTYKADIKDGAGNSSATFTVTESIASGDRLSYAVFPHASLSGGKFSYPAAYNNYKSGSFPAPLLSKLPDNYAVTGGVINYGDLSFRHIGGLVRVEAVGMPAGVNSMTFTAENGAAITGSASLKDDFTAGDFTGGSSTVTFNFAAASAGASMVFYVPVPAGTVFGTEGFTITMKKDGTAVCTKNFGFGNGYTVGRARVLRGVKMDMSIRFAAGAAGTEFSHKGETKTLAIEGDLSGKTWEVRTSTAFADSYGKAVNGSGNVALTLPSSRFPARGPVTVKLIVDGTLRDRINVYQGSWFNSNNVTANADGSVTITTTGGNSNGYGMTEGFRFGSVTYNFSEVNIINGQLAMEWWGDGQIQVYAGITNGHYMAMNGMAWHDWSSFTNPPAVNDIRSLRFVMKSLEQGALPSEVWINGVKVASYSQWMNSQEYLMKTVFPFNFFIREGGGTASGTVTISSVSYDPEQTLSSGPVSGEDLGIEEYK